MNTRLNVSKEKTNCLLCGGADSRQLYPQLPFVVRCARCGFIFSSPRLTPEAIREFYSKDYFVSHSSQEMGYDNYVSDRRLVEKTFNSRLAGLERGRLKSRGRVLDVGCATGFFLSIARQRGWQTDGVEISDYCCEFAKREFGLSLHQGFFKDMRLTEKYDLVTMWDYLEHSFAPDADLKKAYDVLNPGGILVLTTPDAGSLPAKIFKHRWMGFKEHEHLYYFKEEDLAELFRRSGFRLLERRHEGKHISLKFFSKRLKDYSGVLGKAAEFLASTPLFKNGSFYCNPCDIIYLVAQKKG